MGDKKLYIIGNGFDIFHGVKSGYIDFKNFIIENDIGLIEILTKYFDSGKLWSDFEETLANIDTDTIVDEAMDFLNSQRNSQWSVWTNEYHYDFHNDIRKRLNLVTENLKQYFVNWILQLYIPKIRKLPLSANSVYLNFNFTDTLERNYEIPFSNITYIHNKAVDHNSNLIIGHSRKPVPITKKLDTPDENIIKGNQIVDKYFDNTYKNTEAIISEKQYFFNNLKDIREIFVLGHSISPVDIKYFQTIFKMVVEYATWTVSYYGEEQKTNKLEILIKLGIHQEQIKLIQLAEL